MSLSSDVDALATAIGVRIKGVVADVANKQPLDSDLSAIAALTSAANKVPYATGVGTWALTGLSSFGRTLMDVSSATSARTAIDTYSKPEVDGKTVLNAMMGSVKIATNRSAPVQNTTFGSNGHVTGLAITVVGEGRPVKLELMTSSIISSNNVFAYLYFTQNGTHIGLETVKSIGTADPGQKAHFQAETEILTNGVSYTFAVGVRTAGTTGTFALNATANYPTIFRVSRL